MVIPTSNIHIPRIMTGILCVPHSIGTFSYGTVQNS